MQKTKRKKKAQNKKRKHTHNKYDTAWKIVLERFFSYFLLMVLPYIYDKVDWNYKPDFMDKELQQMMKGAAIGRQYVDKLIRVRLKNGKEMWLLIHIEVQGTSQEEFSYRMFVYHYRLNDCFEYDIVSVAILTDEDKNWRPTTYSYACYGTAIAFSFPVVKLLDFKERWEELEASTNPFATVIMAHLESQATRGDGDARKRTKLRLARRMYDLGYSRDDLIDLMRFLDWVMELPKKLEVEYWKDIQAYEEEKQMPYLMSIERISEQRGKKVGKKEGIQIGKKEGIQIGEQRGKEIGIQIGEQRGKEEGIQIGEQRGEQRGKEIALEGIALALELKFGEDGLALLPEIRQVQDLSVIEALYTALRTAHTLDEVRQVYVPHITHAD